MKYHISEYDYIVPIGSNCRISLALKDLGYRKCSLPLDWTLTSCNAIYKTFQRKFINFMSHESCIHQTIGNYPHVFNTEFNVNISHEKKINRQSIARYKRRSERMINILESGSRVLFIRHHADGAFVANNIIHSDYNDREVKKGNDPLEIFSLYKLHDLISRNYESLEFDIVLFHYKEIKEVSDPRITFVMSKSDNAEHIATEKVPDHIQCIEMLTELNNRCRATISFPGWRQLEVSIDKRAA